MNGTPLPPRSVSELGLASLLTGGFMVLLGGIAVQLVMWMEMNKFSTINPRDFPTMAYAGHAAGGLAVVVSLVAFFSALFAAITARGQNHSSALGIFGMLMSLLAVGVCAAATFAWHTSMVWRLKAIG